MSRLNKIFYIIFTIHLLLLGALALNRVALPPLSHRPIEVHFVTLEPPPPQPLATPIPPQKITAPPPPKATPKPTPKPMPKPVEKSVVKAPKTAPTKPKNKRLDQLAAKARASLAKIDDKPHKQGAPTIEDEDYVAALVERLRFLLRLPAFGSVRIGLTLTREGKVMKVEVLQAHSDVNRDYVVQTLQGQSFPSFQQAFPKEQQHSFTLTFANE